jgi:hypothetical protein
MRDDTAGEGPEMGGPYCRETTPDRGGQDRDSPREGRPRQRQPHRRAAKTETAP